MKEFRVWAPDAQTVQLRLEDSGNVLAMKPENGGWWCVDVAEADAGLDYWFVLDGGEPLPDPVKKHFAKGAVQPLLSALRNHAAQLAVVLRTVSENQATAVTLATLNENDWIGGPIEIINTTIVSRIERTKFPFQN